MCVSFSHCVPGRSDRSWGGLPTILCLSVNATPGTRRGFRCSIHTHVVHKKKYSYTYRKPSVWILGLADPLFVLVAVGICIVLLTDCWVCIFCWFQAHCETVRHNKLSLWNGRWILLIINFNLLIINFILLRLCLHFKISYPLKRAIVWQWIIKAHFAVCRF